MIIRQVVAELFHVDGQTDIKLRVAFRNFANALKIEPYYLQKEKNIEYKF